MAAATLSVPERERLHVRARRLEQLTVGWNVVEAAVAITAGIVAGSVALIGFGVDSSIEVLSAVVLLWRLRAAGANASEERRERVERRALFLVSGTFFLLGAYIASEAVGALMSSEEPDASTVGLVLSALSLVTMPVLAFAKTRTGRQMGSRALVADARETWVCSYLSLALLVGVGLYVAFGWAWADPVGALAMLPVILWQAVETLQEARGDEDED